jgi:hypothetical protein
MLSSVLFLFFASTGAGLSHSITERQTKPYQIRGVQDPIYHLYLQGLPSAPGTPAMGPEATGEYFVISSTIQSQNTSLYLNIGTSTASYLPLTFDVMANTTAWGLEGDTIITEQSSSYGRRALPYPWGIDTECAGRFTNA